MYTFSIAGEQYSSKPIKAVCIVLAVSPHGFCRDCLCGLFCGWGANMLTYNGLKELLNYNPETGIFNWKIDRGNKKSGDLAGCIDSHGYVIIRTSKIGYKAHRLAWFYVYGTWPENHIDHINGIRNDNRIENLRDVSRSINVQNQKIAQRNNKSGLLGVIWNKAINKFVAAIRINGKTTVIGKFDSKELAHEAYINAKRKFHNGCTI